MSDIVNRLMAIVTVYLGPSTWKFMDYLSRRYLGGKSFEEITLDDIPKLIEHLSPYACLLIGKDKTEQLLADLSGLLNP